MRLLRKLLVTGFSLLLLIPTATAQRNSAETHIVLPGETLGVIAQFYDVDMYTLAAENGIGNAHLIHSWQTLTIPSSAPLSVADAPAQGAHIVQRGETLESIAAFYDINLFELQALNNIYHGWIYPGDALLLPVPGRESQAAVTKPDTILTSEPVAEERVHIVRAGDTLGAIAGTYGVSLYDLQSANEQWSWWIYAGQKLVIPAGGAPPAVEDRPLAPAVDHEAVKPALETAPAPVAGELVHIVQFGESLGKIAEAYGVSLYDLQSVNDLWSWKIYPGQKLIIPEGGAAPVFDVSPPASTRAAPEPGLSSRPDTHVVQHGETLFGIARQYRVALDALMAANAIADSSRIHAGLTLRVRNLEAFIPPAPATNDAPDAAAPPIPAGNRETYTVLPGEFLSQIGAKLGMSWLAIVEVNGIANPDTLHAGTVLQIPTAEEAAKYGPVYSAVTHPGAHVGVGREFVVVLSTQRAYAYEDGVLKHSAVISSGLPDTPTVRGDFRIKRKVHSQTMSGADYYLENVEWVMYFYAGYAFHGTWWHYNFGTPMSRGCINMTNADAKWFYEFGEIGTPVHVRN